MAGPFKMKGNPMQRNFGIGSPVKYEKDPYEFLTRKGGEDIEAMGPRDKEGRYGEGEFPDFIMDQHLEKTKTKPTTEQKQDTKKEKPKKKHEMSKSERWNPKTQSWEQQ